MGRKPAKSKKNKDNQEDLVLDNTLIKLLGQRSPEIIGIILIFIGAFGVLSYFFGENLIDENPVGSLGNWLYRVMWGNFGFSSLVLPVLTIFWGVNRLGKHPVGYLIFRTFLTICIMLTLSTLIALFGASTTAIGQFAFSLKEMLISIVGAIGTGLLTFMLLTIEIIIITEANISNLIFPPEHLKDTPTIHDKPIPKEHKRLVIVDKITSFFNNIKNKIIDTKTQEPIKEPIKEPIINNSEPEKINKKPKIIETKQPEKVITANEETNTSKQPSSNKEEPVIMEHQLEGISNMMENDTNDLTTPSDFSPEGYKPPTLDLLVNPPETDHLLAKDELLKNSELLENKLRDFGVEGKVVNVSPGPVVTQYAFRPAPGIKVSKIVGLADDLAMVMRAKRIRIVAPIPGKAAVGIELPNEEPEIVYLKEILESEAYTKINSKLTLALGKDIVGEPYCVDLRRMPHLLIAGATGSGKSVCIGILISSILYKSSPAEVRFLMIDPKMVELAIYNGIPHLLTPVVTRPKEAVKALHWACLEMERRYKALAGVGVRNIDDYNVRITQYNQNNELDVFAQKARTPLPYLIIVIDELADLMITVGNEIEDAIARLAQMARAVGIHIVLATQRPSVDVVTGLIKANFPSRIAFQVSSKVNSRTILDENGAEKLLGNGDMLFLPPGKPEPIRIHGAFITREETEEIVKFLGGGQTNPFMSSSFQPTNVYSSQPISNITDKEGITIPTKQNSIFDEIKTTKGKPVIGGGVADDDLYEDAVRLVVRHQQGSISLIQRRLRVGYARAARLIDIMEQNDIVGPFDGSKAREVLVKPSDIGMSVED